MSLWLCGEGIDGGEMIGYKADFSCIDEEPSMMELMPEEVREKIAITDVGEIAMKELTAMFEILANAFNELWEPIRMLMDDINNYICTIDYEPKRKEVYRNNYHGIKQKSYKPNHKTRFFCIGNKGNYRRF